MEWSWNLPAPLLRNLKSAQVNSWEYKEVKDVAGLVIEYKLDNKQDPVTHSTRDIATKTSEVIENGLADLSSSSDPTESDDSVVIKKANTERRLRRRRRFQHEMVFQAKQKTKPMSSTDSDSELELSETCIIAEYLDDVTIDTCGESDHLLYAQLPSRDSKTFEIVPQDSNGTRWTCYEPEIAFRLSIPNSGLPCLPPSIGRYTRLRVLYLTGNKLQNLPRDLAKLRNLELLRLGNNYFRSIPDVVYQLTELRSLDMSNNRLETQGITGNIKKLTKLESLVLNANEIHELNIGIFDLEHLIFLDASRNPISVIPKEVQKLKKLEYLRLKMCRLQTLPEELGDLPRLVTICVSENMISKVPVEKFQKMGQLRTICLHSNPLFEQVEALVKLRQLKDVRLCLNYEPSAEYAEKCCLC